MERAQLIASIRQKRSFLCVGLDPDIRKIPPHLLETEDPIFEFNKAIIDATVDICVAYKPNLAFYEVMGSKGWESLQKTAAYIPPGVFTIADAKRGDIGNTADMYASTFFETMHFDAVTIAPYMGEDSILPFLKFKSKWVAVLALTSNSGSKDFQQLDLATGKKLFEEIVEKSMRWGSQDQLMFVVGATHGEEISRIREIAPDHFFLIPGVGTQGGNLSEVSARAMNKDIGILVNASRSIIYASSGLDFADRAREEALRMREEMSKLMDR